MERIERIHALHRILSAARYPVTVQRLQDELECSRATAYRHFPDVNALIVEASLDLDTPQPEQLFLDGPPEDPVARMERVDSALEAMIRDNEVALRLMMKHALDRSVRRTDDSTIPMRQNRRTPLIEAALEPARRQFRPVALKTLTRALAMVVGTESMLALKDVLQLDDTEARRVRRWAIRALVDAARKPATAT